jgi:hypothetical protein
MNLPPDRRQRRKRDITRFAFAMFDVLGFSKWLESVEPRPVLDSYHPLMDRVVVRPNDKGGLSSVQTQDGVLFTITG